MSKEQNMVARAEGSFETVKTGKRIYQFKKQTHGSHFYYLQFPDWRHTFIILSDISSL